jgi:hypothetical protein
MSRVISSFTDLGVAGDALELLDVDGGEDVLLDHGLRDQDRVFEVVPAPRHEGDQHVLPQGQLAHVAGRAIPTHFSDSTS